MLAWLLGCFLSRVVHALRPRLFRMPRGAHALRPCVLFVRRGGAGLFNGSVTLLQRFCNRPQVHPVQGGDTSGGRSRRQAGGGRR